MGVVVQRWQLTVAGQRLRRKRRGLRSCGKRGADGQAQGQSEKMSAFHVLLSSSFASSIVRRVWRASAECALNQPFRKHGSLIKPWKAGARSAPRAKGTITCHNTMLCCAALMTARILQAGSAGKIL
jgi:hypothetical protein